MLTVTATDLVRRFKHYGALAQRRPVLVTHDGREELVLLSVGAHRRLEAIDDREVLLAGKLPEDLVAELEKPVPAYETELDHLLEDQGSAGDREGG